MNLTVNGKSRHIEAPDTEIGVLALLERFEINPRLVAVAINGDVIPKKDYAATSVRHGDTVEIVRMVGGG